MSTKKKILKILAMSPLKMMILMKLYFKKGLSSFNVFGYGH